MKKAEKGVGVRMHNLYNADIRLKSKKKRAVRAFVTELIFSVIMITAICVLPTVHLYAKNAGEVSFAELGPSMWIFMAISLAVFAILRLFLRKPYFACTLVAVAALLSVNFNWLAELFLLFIDTYFFAILCGIILCLVLIAGFFFLLRLLFKKGFPVHIIDKILSVALAGLVLFNVVLAAVATGKAGSENTQAAVVTSSATAASAPVTTPSSTTVANSAEVTTDPTLEPFGLPNVYFFILDEFSTFDILSKYYGYDAKVFDDFLAMEGFNTIRESYSTDTQTEHSICDTLNLEYISRHLSKNECFEAIADAELYSVFSNLGYSQFQYSSSNDHFEGITSLKSDSGKAAYEAILLEQGEFAGTTPAVPDATLALLASQAADSSTDVNTEALNQWNFYPSSYIRGTNAYKEHARNGEANAILKAFDYFENPANYAATTPRVTYCYLPATHVPFVFNEYGSLIPYSDSRNWRDEDVYLGQYKFISKHMLATLSTIIENDPDSIIIIMSDHGIRYHADCSLTHKFYITDKDSCRIFNAVYIKGQQYDMQGLSAINTLRYILSLYEGMDYPPIEDPITSDSPDDLSGIIPRPR